MTRRLLSKYKGIRQNYIDIWENGKRGVKPLKKVYVLNILMQLVEKKKKVMRILKKKKRLFHRKTQTYTYVTRKNPIGLTGKLFAEANVIILPLVEQALRNIPRKYMDLNRKTRVYKYLRRNNKKLLQSMDKILSEIILILEKKRRKPFWRRTAYEHFLRKKQLLQTYYGNINFHWFRSSCRKKKFYLAIGDSKPYTKYNALDFYKYLESRLDIVLFRSGLVRSVAEARQCINHGKIFVNSVLCRQPSFILREGDVISWEPVFFQNKLRIKRLQLCFYFYEIISLFVKQSRRDRHLSKASKETFYWLRNVLNALTQDLSEYTVQNDLIAKDSIYPSYQNFAWDGIELETRLTKFRFLLRDVPEHLLISEKASVLIFLQKPTIFLYPFEMDITDFKKIVNYLNI